MAEIAERKFEFYLHFPSEVRMIVVDEMEVDDRVRFTRCSKLCSKEAKASKKYIRSLVLNVFHDFTLIQVNHGSPNRCRGFMLSFHQRGERKYKEYSNLGFRSYFPCVEVDLDSSTDPIQCDFEDFRNKLDVHQKTIKKLQIEDIWGKLKNFDFGIRSLPNLEELIISGEFDIQQILSKIHRPLKELCVHRVDNNVLLQNCEKIYQVQEKIILHDVQLENQHFLRLSAKIVIIPIGKLTENDIFDFIQSWRNGKSINIKRYEWNLENSKFDKKKLWNLLGFSDYEGWTIDIKHCDNLEKIAKLTFDHSTLKFKPDN